MSAQDDGDLMVPGPTRFCRDATATAYLADGEKYLSDRTLVAAVSICMRDNLSEQWFALLQLCAIEGVYCSKEFDQ